MNTTGIDLYSWAIPNGWKASCILEELGLPYTLYPVDITKGQQRAPEYLALNPNAKIPTIVDHDVGNFSVFESGAIMIYLAEKAGRLLPAEFKARLLVIQWLMFQMGGVGPMQGQANVFFRYFPEHLPAAIARYQNEVRRLNGVLDRRLADNEWLATDFLHRGHRPLVLVPDPQLGGGGDRRFAESEALDGGHRPTSWLRQGGATTA